MTEMWIYLLRAWNKSGSSCAEAVGWLTPHEYTAIKWRMIIEQEAEERLRHTEGVTDDMKREYMGWTREVLPDSVEGEA